ncbi:hypothetical protein [Paenibacillus illinoisensis]|uniref:hypothetical protein n=1 Tax=Paenibacillus illinoisensis TaxID=59845 RepID=UPI003015E02C
MANLLYIKRQKLIPTEADFPHQKLSYNTITLYLKRTAKELFHDGFIKISLWGTDKTHAPWLLRRHQTIDLPKRRKAL